MELTESQLDRARGVLVATAAGDALGAGYEFGPSFDRSTPVLMKGGGPFGFEPGEWTDDTSMAIVLAKAVTSNSHDLKQGNFDSALSDAVLGWIKWAATSKDVGAQTSTVLHGVQKRMLEGENAGTAAFSVSENFHRTSGRSGGNGSLMRTAPLALAYLHSEQDLWEAAEKFSALTHWELDGREACQLWTVAIRHAVLTGEIDIHRGLPMLDAERAAVWSYRITEAEKSQPKDFKRNGWVVHAFQGAWSSIINALSDTKVPDSDVLRASLENAVRGGNDTDTVAAITGGLIGAGLGYSSIPPEWIQNLHGYGVDSVDELVELSLNLIND